MSKLIYSAITSLDGFVADERGNFDWAAPDEEVHRFVNELERPVGTYLLGRRMYEVMRFWDTPAATTDQPAVMTDYAELWRAADKIVFSKTLGDVTAARTRLEREFDAGVVGRMKSEARRDLSVGGPHLAARAIRSGLVDELQVFLTPVVVGRGNHWLPDDLNIRLDLLDEQRFRGGVVYLRYRLNLDP